MKRSNGGRSTSFDRFWANWCGPCRMMSPVIDKIAEEMGDKVKVCKVNVDENHELAEKYEIMTIPAFIIVKMVLKQEEQ